MKRLEMIQTVVILVFTAWRLRFCGFVVDSNSVGGVDHAYDGGHPFATSVVRSNSLIYFGSSIGMPNKAIDKSRQVESWMH